MKESWARSVAGPYTDAVAIIAESALPSTLFGVAYLVTFALKSDVSVFFLSVYVMFTVSAPGHLHHTHGISHRRSALGAADR